MIVIGGGDTGADCVGNAHREGAASVTQIELLGEPPQSRPDDLTPWPRWPMKYRRSYAIKEGGEQDFSISTTKLTGNGRVEQIHWVQNTGTPPFDPIPGTEESHPAGLVLLAMGFLSPEGGLLEALGVEKDPRGNAKAGAYATSADGVFAAGDARRGQSLIVWAINEGRQCARMVDRYLRGLPERDPKLALSAGASRARTGAAPDLGADLRRSGPSTPDARSARVLSASRGGGDGCGSRPPHCLPPPRSPHPLRRTTSTSTCCRAVPTR